MGARGHRSSPTTSSSTPSKEQINLSLPRLAAGTHILMVKATDAAGNIGTADALLDVKGRVPQ